jgi:hypothetical protein
VLGIVDPSSNGAGLTNWVSYWDWLDWEWRLEYILRTTPFPSSWFLDCGFSHYTTYTTFPSANWLWPRPGLVFGFMIHHKAGHYTCIPPYKTLKRQLLRPVTMLFSPIMVNSCALGYNLFYILRKTSFLTLDLLLLLKKCVLTLKNINLGVSIF